MANVPISERLGPRIEGVVSPVASRQTIRRALDALDRDALATTEAIRRASKRPAAPRAGGGAPQPAPRAAETPAETPAAGGGADNELARISADAVRDAIAALEAELGMTIDEIAALGGEVGARAQRLLAELDRQAVLEREQLIGSLLRRGLFRSGIALRERQRLEEAVGMRKADVEARKGEQLRRLEMDAAQAKIDFERRKADIEAAVLEGNLDAETAQALLDDLEKLTFKDLQLAAGEEK